MQRRTAKGLHLHIRDAPVAPNMNCCAQFNTENYTGIRLHMRYSTLSYLDRSDQTKDLEPKDSVQLTASKILLRIYCRVPSKGASLHARQVPIAPMGACCVRGCDGLGSRASETPCGTTGRDTQKVELSCANSCAKEDRTFGKGLSLQSCISKETK